MGGYKMKHRLEKIEKALDSVFNIIIENDLSPHETWILIESLAEGFVDTADPNKKLKMEIIDK